MDQTWTTETAPNSPDETSVSAPQPTVLAELYLRACAAGAPCNDLALALANAVLDNEFVRLALSVLDSEKHRHAKATELAGKLLDAADPECTTKARGNERV